jgi:hypothetical protein
MTKLKTTVAILLALSLSACKVGPNYKRPATTFPDQYRGTAPAAGQPTQLFADTLWAAVYQDEVLQGLIKEALTVDAHDPPLEQERQRQEQRRLFYVGITRSTETLVLNSSIRMALAMACTMRMPLLAQQGGDAILPASPLLSELGTSAPAVIVGASWRAQLGF